MMVLIFIFRFIIIVSKPPPCRTKTYIIIVCYKHACIYAPIIIINNFQIIFLLKNTVSNYQLLYIDLLKNVQTSRNCVYIIIMFVRRDPFCACDFFFFYLIEQLNLISFQFKKKRSTFSSKKT